MLARCDYTIGYHEDKNNLNADALRRLSLPEIVSEISNPFALILDSNSDDKASFF